MQLTELQPGCHPQAPGQAQEVGPWESHEVKRDKVQGSALGLGQLLVSTQAGAQTDQEQPCQKGPGSAGE